MNAVELLHDWKPGDTVQADELNALCEAVRQVEARLMSAQAGGTHGGVRVEGDGVVEMPWQVYAVQGGDGLELRVVPGEVLCGMYAVPPGEGGGIQYGYRYGYMTLPETATKVETGGVDMTQRQTVWLELRGSVEVDELDASEIPDGYAMEEDGWRHDVTRLVEPALRVTMSPEPSSLRWWALAVWEPGHVQPLTQLQWGTLSALELRGLLDMEGRVVEPSDSPEARWGTKGHEQGMAAMCDISGTGMFGETFDGKLWACLDYEGAMEFYLGEREWVTQGGGDDGGGGDGVVKVPVGDDEVVIEDKEDMSNPWDEPMPDDPAPDEPDPKPRPGTPTNVKYGYVAGEGFASCELMIVDGEEKWVLELDAAYLASVCADLQARGNVTIKGSGSTPAWRAAIDMGLGGCSASATGCGLAGMAGLCFHGTNSVDTSKKTETVKVTYKCSPQWMQAKRWILSPKQLAEAGSYVSMEAGTYKDAFVSARYWYRFRIDKAKFRKHAEAYFKSGMGKVQVSASAESSSGASMVHGTLGGSMLALVATFQFS